MAFERSKMVLAKAGVYLPVAHAPDTRAQHIVDHLITERGRKIVNSPFWPLIRPALHRILNYDEAIRMTDELAPLSGSGSLDLVSQLLKLDLEVSGADRIPATGAFLMAANHPTGLADAIAVYDAIRPKRRDVTFFANRDALRVNRRFGDVVIPVEWRDDLKSRTKSRETLVGTNRAVSEERAIVLFPSGRIAYWGDGRLNERPWQTSIVSLARRYELPVLPIHVSARNSWLFYWFANWNTELRDMTVFHELLNKKRKKFAIRIGKPIEPDRLCGDVSAMTMKLQRHCTVELAVDGNTEFTP
jgi:putative hemolysin